MGPTLLSLDFSFVGPGQGWTQVVELLIAFVLSSIVGFERELRGKAAGLRTQAIVGTASALILMVSKYGFADVIGNDVILDPSRIAAQIVSGIGFLGAGLIITRQGAIRGLTTAAAVWETAAIGMAAGAGLPLLAVVVTVLHFVTVLGFTPLIARLPGKVGGYVRVHVTYRDGLGVLRQMLSACTAHGWTVTSMTSDLPGATRDAEAAVEAPSRVAVVLTLTGPHVQDAMHVLAGVAGVEDVVRTDEEGD